LGKKISRFRVPTKLRGLSTGFQDWLVWIRGSVGQSLRGTPSLSVNILQKGNKRRNHTSFIFDRKARKVHQLCSDISELLQVSSFMLMRKK
jgi:hypothetical protein